VAADQQRGHGEFDFEQPNRQLGLDSICCFAIRVYPRKSAVDGSGGFKPNR